MSSSDPPFFVLAIILVNFLVYGDYWWKRGPEITATNFFKRDDYFPLVGCYRNSVVEHNENEKLSKATVFNTCEDFF